jgi:hypothetical protein
MLETTELNADVQVDIVVIQELLVQLLDVTATMIVHLTSVVLMNNALIHVCMIISVHQELTVKHKIMLPFVNVHQVWSEIHMWIVDQKYYQNVFMTPIVHLH